MLPKCSPASPASNGLRHGATTITDPVQMMWQQQQIQPPSPPPLPPTSTAPAPRPTVHMWPPLDQATATSRTVGGPQRQQSQQQSPHPQQQQQQQQPSGVQSSGFQPFAHGLPQLRTSTMQSSSLMCPPSPSLSMLSPHASLHPPGPPSSPSVRSPHANIAPLGSAASMGSAGGSPYHAQLSELANFGNSSHQNGQHAAGTLPPPLPANAVTGNRDTPHSASLQSHAGPGQASQEGQLLQATVNGDVTDSTFHLPSGLAEQLSDCHQTPQHSNKVLQQQGLQQNSSRPAADLPSAAHQVMHQQPAQQQRAGPSIRKAKLRSPPGFSKPLDGAAKPFVPSNVTWSRPGSNPGLPITPAAANGKVRSNNTQSQVFAPPGFSHDSRGQQPANLATGQWAMTNGTSIYQGTAHVGSPFDQSSRHRTASDAGSTDSWQVPIMQSQLSQKNSDDTPAAPCFLDSEHDKTSGLAPHMVLEFLGIGHSDERTSNA